jgi:diguanylate cyclase (GGDEF)-like protein
LDAARRAAREGRDPLTGILARDRLLEEVARAVAGAERYGEPVAVCVLDLDQFRLVNDTHGYAAGDRLLASAAAAMRGRLRATDALGRIGADEFAVVLPRTDAEAARAVAGDLLAAVRDRARGPAAEGREVRLTASVGVAAVEPGQPATAAAVLARADYAMLTAKLAGRDRLAVAEPDGHDGRGGDHLSWAARVREALETGGLDLHAQPIVPLAHTRAPLRYELLVRLRDAPELASAELVGAAERFGQIQAVDGWMVTRAIGLLTETEGTILHVNLAAASIGDPELMTFVERTVLAAGIAPGRLVFEVTETAAIADVAAARRTVERLRATGCRFALDDFGAGFASFGFLKQLPFDVLKIDGEFVRDLPGSLVDRLAVEAMVGIARGLGVTTVAEYVSGDETVALLRELGVDHAQGYHVGAPRPAADVFP